MRTLTAFLCLTLAVLLFSAGEGWGLPRCPGSYDQNTWYNCFGTLTFGSGAKYVGEFMFGKAHGQGTSTYADGDEFVGEWRDGKYHGQGTYTTANGNEYVGEFRDDKARGQGTYTLAGGGKYVGKWTEAENIFLALYKATLYTQSAGAEDLLRIQILSGLPFPPSSDHRGTPSATISSDNRLAEHFRSRLG